MEGLSRGLEYRYNKRSAPLPLRRSLLKPKSKIRRRMQNIKVTIQEDGFTISVSHHEIQPGDPLVARVELPTGWETQELNFEVNTHTGLFRHPAMFVYTGQKPSRVLIQSRAEVVRPVRTLSRLFDPQRHNFACYPAYHHRLWMDDDYLPFWLGNHYEDSGIDPSLVDSNYFPGGGSSGGAGASGSFGDDSGADQPANQEDSSGGGSESVLSETAAGGALLAGADPVDTADLADPAPDSSVDSEPDAYSA